MKIRVNAALIFGALMLLSLTLSQTALCGGFVADMVEQSAADTITSRIFVQDSTYRIETVQDGMQLVILVDQRANLTRVCIMDEKAYVEMASDDIRSMMNDPFQGLKGTLETPGAEHKILGTEKVAGVECTKHVILWGDSPFYTYYVSDEYELPLKIVRGDSEKVIELTNIEQKELDPAIFVVPDGFSKVEEPDSDR